MTEELERQAGGSIAGDTEASWCGPLLLVLKRPASEEECEFARALLKGLKQERLLLFFLVFFFLLGLPALSLEGHSIFPELIRPWMFLGGMVASLLVIPLHWKNAYQRAALRRALEQRVFLCFEGVVPPAYPQRWLRRLLRGSNLQAESGSRHRLELLAVSDELPQLAVVIAVDGKRQAKLVRAFVGSTAREGATPYTARLESITHPVTGKVLHIEQRHLTLLEREELAREIRRLRWGRPLPLLLLPLLSFLLFGLLVGSLSLRGSWSTAAGALGALPAIAWAIRHKVRMLRAAARLEADLVDGRVLLYHVEGENLVTEHLRSSQTVWTLKGVPASWRLLLAPESKRPL
jgi:hypothetical protein